MASVRLDKFKIADNRIIGAEYPDAQGGIINGTWVRTTASLTHYLLVCLVMTSIQPSE